MTIDEQMLTRAMRTAVELGVFPKVADEETYLKNWDAMEKILKSALQKPARTLTDKEIQEQIDDNFFDEEYD